MAFIGYELLRLAIILRDSALLDPVGRVLAWYLAVPLLALVPVFFLALALDEERFKLALPVIALIKAFGIIATVVFTVTLWPYASRIDSGAGYFVLGGIGTGLLLSCADLIPGIWTAIRGKKLCT